MTQVKHTTGNAKAKAEYNAFKQVKAILQTRLDALTPAQRNQVLDILNNWGTATTAQKVEALMGCVALLYMVVAWLAFREFKS